MRTARSPPLELARLQRRPLPGLAIGGFYRLHLDPGQWLVGTGKALSWPIEQPSAGIGAVFPSMRTDI
ncbi:MAG: hypothetical protein EA413_02410, partial [Cyanobium sp. PLM2.Bin73]